MDVRELTTADELHAASALFAAIWRPADPMPFELLRVVRHIGGYIAGAYDGDTMIGASVAFPTAGDDLHSHITGVTVPDRGVGFAIKMHQRVWALAHGFTSVNWTFDPLVRRNAYFNLGKLATHVADYLEDFYGDMPDELNAGGPSDRLLVLWPLTAPEVVAAAEGVTAVPAAPPPGTVTVLDEDASGGPLAHDAGEAVRLAVGTPADVTALRATDPGLGRRWRYAQRAALTAALGRGLRVTGFTRSGHYVLEEGR